MVPLLKKLIVLGIQNFCASQPNVIEFDISIEITIKAMNKIINKK